MVVTLASCGRAPGTGLQVHPGTLKDANDHPERAIDYSDLGVGDAVFFRRGTVHRVPASKRPSDRIILSLFL